MLKKVGLDVQKQVDTPIRYDGLVLNLGFKLDVLVEGRVICELKSVDKAHRIHRAQLITYLKLTKLTLGFLINFNVLMIGTGIQRVVWAGP
ncbi:MAG: GxxExxY protein [Planctomycetota bacterium]